ncbi:FGGY-family carbohydrate kinase [Catenulispora sp. NL8]|uniref:FGGY-family carbohydrate kinase n=1 Tax=Catenulispora pinistramenti TaxID=2705254 RepID=A0ABS5KV64_9ACTN|nr:FGGY-family carbohydrate kinase [Catenulispora pinistramenti]MBS2549942.1 FGGY-family carbohydrate kinase [Catenulispora pinistramenti]
MGLTLGVDIGTASSKGVLVAADGTVLAQATRPHAVSSPRPEWFEHDPELIWWADFRQIVAELLAALPAVPGGPQPIDAIAVSGIGPCLLPADAEGRPLRPAILYGIDTRATAQIAEQSERLGGGIVLARCGSPLTSQAIGPKFGWLAEHEPKVAAATRRWFMASSYLTFRLTGEYVLDHHSASQSVPLYSQRENAWIEDWCRQIAPDVEFPRLAWPTEIIGGITAGAAAETGLPAGTPVLAGTIDAWSEAAGVGVLQPGDSMLMYGTTMFLVHVTRTAYALANLWGPTGLLPGTNCLAAGMATSGAVTSWLADLTATDYATLTTEATALPPGADGLLMLPYFAGERTPLFDPDARGVLAGLTLHHTRGHLYRAALEATAFGVRHNLEAIALSGEEPDRYVAVGGGTTGGLWTQIVSDVIGRPQQIPRHTIGAAYGDAFLAAVAAGNAALDDIAAWNPVDHVVAPDPARHRIYTRLYAQYRNLYPATARIVHSLVEEAATERRSAD